MKKICLYAFLLILIFSFPEKGFSWGSATHAYIAKELGKEIADPQMLYGAAAPDFIYDSRSLNSDYLFKQTHLSITNLKKKARKMDMAAFAFGFMSHNEKWGADYTAHKKGRTTKKGYVVTKAILLEPEMLFHLQAALEDAGVPYSFLLARALASDLAHKLTEIAIDLQIRLHEDTSIGLDFLNSAQSAHDTIPELLENTYGHGLSKRLKITREEANHSIAEAESDFRQLMVRYGELLNQQDSTDFHALSEEGAALLNTSLKNITGKDVVIQPEVMRELMNLAMQNVEADYAQEISATISYLKKRKEISSFLKTILRNR
jgi:hypothetical protein